MSIKDSSEFSAASHRTRSDIHIGIIIATMVLVDILFWIDQYYQNLLFGAVLNARRLEALTGRRLIEFISDENRPGILNRSFQIALIYMGFLVALWILGTISAEGATSQPSCPNQCAQLSDIPTSGGSLLSERISFNQVQDERIIPNFPLFTWILLEVALTISLVATIGYVVTLQIKVSKRRRENYEDVRAKLREIESALRDKKLRVQELEEQRSTLLRRQENISYPFFLDRDPMVDKIISLDKEIISTNTDLVQARDNLRKELENLDNEIRKIFDRKRREKVKRKTENRENENIPS